MKNTASNTSLLKAIDLVNGLIQGASVDNIRRIQVPADVVLPPELELLVANVNMLIDQTVQEQAAFQANLQSDKMATLGEVVAGTSHELNNPLAIVTGYSDLLLEDPGLSSGQRSKIESIRKSAMRAAGVVRSLLAFARKRKPHRIQTDLNVVVEAAFQLTEYDFRAGGILFEKNLSSRVQSAFADPHQMEQVILNILNNARDAVLAEGSNKPWIAISTEDRADRIFVKVQDSGIGIPEANLSRVFDPFFTTKRAGKNTGLGLSICYGIIREHGGEITITSRCGEGTVVVVAVPKGDPLP